MFRQSDGIAVLHVDDDPDFADLVGESLEHQNKRIDVVTATNVSDGLATLTANEIDCIVSDYDMPERNGIEFLNVVRESHPGLPFILYTGKGSEEVASKAISAGVTDYLQKEAGTSQYEILANRITNVVEQHRTREKVSQVEERLWTIAENTNDILWMFSADWSELLFVNSAYEEISGDSIDELRADPASFAEGIHPDDRSRVEEAMAQLSAGNTVDLEYRVNEAEEFGRWVWVQGKPVFDDSSEVKWVVGFARDITDRKQREQDLQRYRTYLENVSDIATVFDTDGTIQYDSPAVEDHLGYDPDDRVGENAFEYIHPEDRAAVQLRVDRMAEPNTDYESDPPEFRIQHRDGSWRWFEGRGSVYLEEPVEGIITSNRDITERKQRERELQELRERTEMALCETNTSIWEWDVERGEIRTLYNPLDELSRRDVETSSGVESFLQNVVHPDDRTTVVEAYEQAVHGENEQMRVEFRTDPESGDLRWYRVVGHLESDSDTRVVVGLLTDITEQKRREDRLEEFASVVSHDLKNPLTVAQGRLALAKEVCETTHHDGIERALDRMSRIIENLLLLAREGRDIGTTERVDLGEAIDSTWPMATDQATDATLCYASDDCQLPSVTADYDRLCQLLENVFANAVEHGDDDVTVTVGVVEDGFYIEDDGPGIPEEDRDDVFEVGYSTTPEGTGFGLSIVKRVVDAHGWEIRVTDGSHGGACFEITGVEIPE